MDFAAAKTLLASQLRALDATGAGGFEGLMRDCLEALTGQRYRLAKSGVQGGSDVRSTNHLSIGLEAKRYGQATTLSTDALRAKVADAAAQAHPVDVWILAATREIAIQDIEALKAQGEHEGIAVEIFDWPEGPNSLPRLAVLCAAARNATVQHLGLSQDLDEALAVVEGHPSYVDFEGELRRSLLAPEIGYRAATAVLTTWMLDAQRSEAAARARLGEFNDLLASNTKLAPRPQVHQLIHDWWQAPSGPAALIGGEGHGKTWAALSWWDELAASNEDAPLTLFLSARKLDGDTIEDVIAHQLASITQTRDAAFWLKRMRQWSKGDHEKPLILLIVDGLDQNWLKTDWSDFLQPLFDPQWRGLFTALMTCWPDHWRRLHDFADLAPRPVQITVPQFTRAELDALLALHGKAAGDFAESVLELMLVPRLSLLAIARQAELAASGDITPERLAYEDWKDRVRRRPQRAGLTDAEFRSFVTSLAADLQHTIDTATVSRRDLLERMGDTSGLSADSLGGAIGELIAGRWLTATGKPNQFRIDAKLAPFALGLALSSLLSEAADKDSAQATVAEYLHPFKAQSLGVAILRATTTALLVDPRSSKHARSAAIEAWIDEQNFGRSDFEALWRLVGLDPTLFCDIAEHMWLLKPARSFTDEVMMKGLANAFQYEEVAKELIIRAKRWLAYVELDPDLKRAPARLDPDGVRSDLNKRRSTQNLETWRKTASVADWPTLYEAGEGNHSALSRRTLGVLSYIERARFIDAIIAWALSRGVMQAPLELTELAWVLRLAEDYADTSGAISEAVLRLDATGDKSAQRGARWLREALGDEANAAIASKGPKDDLPASVAASLAAAAVTRASMFEESLDLPTAAPLLTLEGAALWRDRTDLDDVDSLLERQRAPMARDAPQTLRDILGAAASSAEDRDDAALEGLADAAPQFFLALTDLEFAILERAVSRERNATSAPPDDGRPTWRTRELRLKLWDKPAAHQIEILKTFPATAQQILEVKQILVAPENDVLTDALATLNVDADDEDRALAWLQYLNLVDDAAPLKTWNSLGDFVTHKHDTIRSIALSLAWRSENEDALKRLGASDWTSSKAASKDERMQGSFALCIAAERLNAPQWLERASPDAIACLYGDPRNTSDVYRNAFASLLEEAIMKIEARGSRVLPAYSYTYDSSTRRLLRDNPDAILTWFRPWHDAHPKTPGAALLEHFPLVALCQALMQHDPTLAFELWNRMRVARNRGVINRNELDVLPLHCDVDIPPDVERAMLNSATTDDRLIDLCIEAHRNERQDFLLKRIRSDLQAIEVGDRARGITLLGYAEAAPEFDTIWAELADTPPQHGWLLEVYLAAKRRYTRNVEARAAHRAFLTEPDPTLAYAHYEVFIAKADNRAVLWAQQDMNALTDRNQRAKRAHWRVNAHRIDQKLKARRERAKGLLYHTAIVKAQAPWM